MGVESLQNFVEGGHMEGVAENVDLLHVARNIQTRQVYIKGKPPSNRLCLVLDAECCLDRLYGGYFSDWTCGGQWNRMVQFLNQLLSACQKGNIEFTVAFNGALEKKRMPQWIQREMANRQKVQNVLRHVYNKGTPPPKVWWIPPPCLITALRLTLRHLNISMMCSIQDHHEEVLAFCRSNNYNGIVGDDAEYLVFDPPRYFSARTLKLTFKGSLETREFLIKKLAIGLGLDMQRLCILTALLGNHILTEAQLTPFYAKLNTGTIEQHQLVEILANYVKNLDNCDNLNSIAVKIFDDPERQRAFIESSQYYLKANPKTLADSSKIVNGKTETHDDQKISVVNGTKDTENATPPAEEEQGLKSRMGRLHPEVFRTAAARHQSGFLSPLIYQILTQGEIKLPVILEDENLREIANIHTIYQQVRQSIYAILLNVHHQLYLAKMEPDKHSTELPTVKEWEYPYLEPNIVRAEPIPWSVPTIQRLWFGTNVEDSRRRLRAFLTCMRSDNAAMVSIVYVPQHLLIMATVLRYLMQVPVPVLRQLELDAFLVTAFYPNLVDSDYTQELQLQMVTPRGVHLANLFMQGVDYAILSNEACGAPIPYLMCNPGLFFDGKLFHNILNKAEHVKSLQELCNHRMEILVKVERLRHAILENLHVQYARRPYGNNFTNQMLPYASAALVPANFTQPPPLHPPPQQAPQISDRRPNNLRQRRTVSARGGQLEVAGVVVGSWGPNYSLARNRNPIMNAGRGIYDGFAYNAQNQMPNRRRINSNRRGKGRINERKNWNRNNNEATPRQDVPSTSSGGSSAEESNTEDVAPANGVPSTSTDETA